MDRVQARLLRGISGQYLMGNSHSWDQSLVVYCNLRHECLALRPKTVSRQLQPAGMQETIGKDKGSLNGQGRIKI